MKMVRVAIARSLGESQRRQAAAEDRQSGIKLQPRQRRADAEMDAGPERHMRVRRAVEIEASGISKHQGIAIGGAEQQTDPLAFAERDAVDLGVLQRIAGEQVQRWIKAQQFVDHDVELRLSRARKALSEPMFEDGFDAVADRMHGRLVPGVEQQHDGRDQFVLAEAALVRVRRDEL